MINGFHSLQVEEGIRDISLQDFADNSRTTPRLKKSLLIVNKQKRHLAPSNAILEKPVDILEDFPHEEEEEVENRIVSEDPTLPIPMASQSSPTHQHNSTPTVQFPPEIWVLLSHYILPEDVARYAEKKGEMYLKLAMLPKPWLFLQFWRGMQRFLRRGEQPIILAEALQGLLRHRQGTHRGESSR